MSALIADIYGALAAMDITLDAVVARVFNIDAIPNSVNTSDVPARLLLPISTQDGAQSVQPVSISGSKQQIVWTITDLLLLAPIGQGGHLGSHAARLARYQMAYVEALRVRKHLLGDHQIIETTIETGIQEYPLNVFWWGAEVRHRVQEWVYGA